MKHIIPILVGALCTTSACKKDDSKDDAVKTPKVADVAVPFTGELTIERLNSLKTTQFSGSDWSKAQPIIAAQVGAATKTINGEMYWLAVEEEKCASLSISVNGSAINSISWAQVFTQESGKAWTDCMTRAGKEVPKEEEPPFEKRAKLSDVTKDDIQTVAKAGGWKFVSLSGMGMGAMDSHNIKFSKDGVEATITFVRPNGKKVDPKSSMSISSAADQAKKYEAEGAAFVDGDALIGVKLGSDKTAAEVVLSEFKKALLTSVAE
ncbi:MAG: hypothetical protein JKY56_14235 [Kofleriaceae bacterium]|nr:hypothetical protein [Kofleriaceae bacterium]